MLIIWSDGKGFLRLRVRVPDVLENEPPGLMAHAAASLLKDFLGSHGVEPASEGVCNETSH